MVGLDRESGVSGTGAGRDFAALDDAAPHAGLEIPCARPHLQVARANPIRYNAFPVFLPLFMPIYEYRCGACGFQKEFLQRLNEKPLTVCPECGKRSFKKMVTAAGFQLKGTGWYATDFRGGTKPAADSGSSGSKTADTKSADAKTDK